MKINRLRALRGYMAYSGLNNKLDQLASVYDTKAIVFEFEKLVPEHISKNCTLLLFRSGELKVYTSSSQWANWLHNRKERIFNHLNNKRFSILNLQIHNSPGLQNFGKRDTNKPDRPSKKAAGIVRNSAQNIEHDPLKKSLQRLAYRLAAKSK